MEAVAIVGMVAGVAQNERSHQAQKKANQKQAGMAQGQAARERREIVRQARIRRSQIINQAALSGTQETSSNVSAQGSLAGQQSSNLADSFSTQALSAQASSYMNRAARFQSQANMANTISGFATNYIQPKV